MVFKTQPEVFNSVLQICIKLGIILLIQISTINTAEKVEIRASHNLFGRIEMYCADILLAIEQFLSTYASNGLAPGGQNMCEFPGEFCRQNRSVGSKVITSS